MFKLNKKIKAFTLAEILITLSIIGIVASLTIPNMMANYQKTQYVVGLKKIYTQFSQVLIKMAADAGCVGDLGCAFDSGYDSDTGDYKVDFDTDLNEIGDKIASYFKVVRTCRQNVDTGCWANKVSRNIDNTNVSSDNDSKTSGYRFVTADGMFIQLADAPFRNCNFSYDKVKKYCIPINFDVNGIKPPNTYGRDIHSFILMNDNGPKIYPEGGPDVYYYKNNNACGANNSKDGFRCTGRVIEEGWEMNY